MTNNLKKLITFASLMALSLHLHAINYYISPTGNDNNAGTREDAPLASLTTVQKKVKAGDKVYIQPGTYQVKENEMMDKTSSKVWDIIFDFATSGTADSPIIYKGVQDAQGRSEERR